MRFYPLCAVCHAHTKPCRLNHRKVVEIVADCNRVGNINAERFGENRKSAPLVYAAFVELDVSVRRKTDLTAVGNLGKIALHLQAIRLAFVHKKHLHDVLPPQKINAHLADFHHVHSSRHIIALALRKVVHIHRIFCVGVHTNIVVFRLVHECFCRAKIQRIKMQQPLASVFGDCAAVKRNHIFSRFVPQPDFPERSFHALVSSPRGKHESHPRRSRPLYCLCIFCRYFALAVEQRFI